MHHYGVDQGWFINMPFWAVPSLFGLVALAAVWSLVWKGLGLWHASRNGDNWWFVAILLINTLGILEIVYLFFVAKMKFDQLFTKGPHHHRHHTS
jgi:hypothetical protein